ncbi:MerR family transcriptional regulator [Levilactobacillus brevis]|uniref:Putative transcriptional regulator n=1 Tax=Levilactobacillus brevis TaxID=1580 RepID=A0A5B7XWY9_LEVBR|nr:MerR family transcriptional regulator [Levilactobacillus brevis]KIO94365.1 Transcriptional regulator, MerR family [Levilactobacillus brevis]KIO99832.1 Transcriptional regulator, MerR family [Levilactobacillus brevis]OLF66966.1 MerR family transcriptional regulator [Levilactobacillus brevis]QCZ52080.1 putative transcriptional regulator [Levilactobacillus brevis]
MTTYSIGEVAEKMGLTVETIRYYDRAGLLPFVKRDSGGRRRFTPDNIQLMQMILDLKRAGVSVKEIAHFVSWRLDGDDSLDERYKFLDQHETVLEDEITKLEQSLAYLRFKKWYYKTATAAGTERIHLTSGTSQVSPQTYQEYERLLASGHTAQDLGDR